MVCKEFDIVFIVIPHVEELVIVVGDIRVPTNPKCHRHLASHLLIERKIFASFTVIIDLVTCTDRTRRAIFLGRDPTPDLISQAAISRKAQ